MAKAKKQEFSIDEKLEQALVPADEQPYEVPSNWVWTKLDYIALYKKGPFGSSLTKAMFVPKSTNTYKVYEQGNAIRKDKNYGSYYISEEKFQEMIGFKVEPGNLIVSCAGTVGETFQLPDNIEPGIINQALMKVQVNENIIMKYFLMYFDQILRDDITGKSKGTAIKNIPPFSVLKNMPFPLPNYREQQRIVDRIENLFEKLDNAKELAQNALDSFQTRKAAILHKAFTGKLTKRGNKHEAEHIIQETERVKDNLIKTKQIQKPKKIQPLEQSDIISEIPDKWVYCKLGGIAFVTKLAGFEYTKYIHLEEKGEIPVIRAQNVRMGYLDTTNLQYIDKKISEQLNRSALYKKSLLITFIGAGIGDICIFDKKERFHLAPNVAKVELYNDDIENILPEYVLYYLLSHYGQKQIFKHLKATAQPSLSMETLRDIVIPIPALSEQKEIVRILDSIFQKEEEAKGFCDVIDKIDLMKKAILARAYRGELGTNDPNEESAIELLKECLK